MKLIELIRKLPFNTVISVNDLNDKEVCIKETLLSELLFADLRLYMNEDVLTIVPSERKLHITLDY